MLQAKFTLFNKQTRRHQSYTLTVSSTAHVLSAIQALQKNSKHIELVVLLINNKQVNKGV